MSAMRPPPRNDPAIAAVASFVWGGMGQAYNSQYGKGLFFFFTAPVLLVPGIIVWAYGIYGACRTGTARVGVPVTGAADQEIFSWCRE